MEGNDLWLSVKGNHYRTNLFRIFSECGGMHAPSTAGQAPLPHARCKRKIVRLQQIVRHNFLYDLRGIH